MRTFLGTAGYRFLAVALALSGALAACRFRTSCPTPEASTGTGGSTGSGGSGASGGSGGSGGGGIGKGDVPPGEWREVTPDLGDVRTLCGPMSFLSSKPDEDLVIAGINDNGLWGTRDGGETWEQMGQGEESEAFEHGTSSILYDPEDGDVFWETGTYSNLGGGVYKTTDGGETFTQLGDIFHNDFISADFTDPERNTLLVSGHEQQILYKSTDGGETWTDIGGMLPEGIKVCAYPYVIDADTYVLGCGGRFDTGMPAILRSTDGGESWEIVHDGGGASAPLIASDGSIYFAEEFGGGLVRSEDGGETWEETVDGTVSSHAPVELPDGRIATIADGTIVISDDQGRTWSRATPELPIEANGFVYSAFQKAFFIWYFTCETSVMSIPDDAILRFDFDYETH